MTRATVNRIVGLGVVTGMRSMAGLTALARGRDGLARPAMTVLALGEMAADKTSAIGDRIDPIPLGGRALMGAVAGAVAAREGGENPIVGGLVGATAAIIATHVAYRLRRRLPYSPATNGLLEDAVVLAAMSFVGSPRPLARSRR